MSSTVTARATTRLDALLDHETVQRAMQFFTANAEAITEEQIRICSIPASPFHEAKRAAYFARRFREIGLSEVEIDEAGNCLALRAGQSSSPLLVVSAHLDTVFPTETDFTVRRLGGRLLGPGISDDGCGLVALAALAEALQTAGLVTEGSILFVATVGEEGEGNLRGVRHLFTKGHWAGQISSFISLDGAASDRITNSALASRRYRVRLQGPGGHSWSDFGIANPIHALGRAISRLAGYPAPEIPRTTFNVGRVEGGSGVNAIPGEAMLEVDLRSANEDELVRLDAFFRRAMREATDDENRARRRGSDPLNLNVALIGERPGGETPADSSIVGLAEEVTRTLGFVPRLDQASTDASFPISLRIPAITLGAGGTSGRSHTLDEWFDPRGREIGLQRALLIALGIVGTK